MAFVVRVSIGGVAVDGTLAAYKNGELRAVAAAEAAPFGPYAGEPQYGFLIYGDTDDTSDEITFK